MTTTFFHRAGCVWEIAYSTILACVPAGFRTTVVLHGVVCISHPNVVLLPTHVNFAQVVRHCQDEASFSIGAKA